MELTPEDTEQIREAIVNPVKFRYTFFKRKKHPAQDKILECTAKVVTVSAGRRFGKSTGLSDSMLHYALTNPDSIQFLLAPTYDQTEITYSECISQLDRSILVHMKQNNHKTPFPQITFTNGSILNFRSTKNPENIRGHKAHRVILDEAAYISDDTVSNVVEPMLADYDGDLWKISTPFGKNHFYRSYQQGLELDHELVDGRQNFASFHFTSLDNPWISKNYILRKAKEYGESSIIFRTEYLGEFVDDQNCVFSWEAIQSSIDPKLNLLTEGLNSHNYVLGVDIAKHVDYTVISVLDSTKPQDKQLVYYDRFNERKYKKVIDTILDVQEAFRNCPIVIDSTGVGDPIYEAIEGYNAFGYVFTNKSKRALVERLQAAMAPNIPNRIPSPEQVKFNLPHPGERPVSMDYRLTFPFIEQLIKELQFYEYTINPSTQTIRFAGRQGVNDDSVMSLGLALWGCTNVEEGNTVALPQEADWDFI